MFNSLEYKTPWRGTQLIQKLGLLNSSNLYWSWYEPRNFGDWIGPFLFKAITRKEPIYCVSSPKLPCTVYFSAGSIMRKIKKDDTAIVWGSGIISKIDDFARPRRIYAVRGPYTRERCKQLGYDCPETYGDPAILMPEFYKPSQKYKKYQLGIIPHFVDFSNANDMYKGLEDVLIVDVTKSVDQVIDDINSCVFTVSSSLHGLIISHAYGVKSAWIQLSDQLEGDNIKFLDYFCAGGVQNVEPCVPKSNWRQEEFISLVNDAPTPNNGKLKKPLLASCPFNTSMSNE